MKTATPLAAVLFDLDGTLLNTAADLTAAANNVLIAHGRSPQQQPLYTAGCTDRMISNAFNIDKNHPQFKRYKQQLIESYQIHLTDRTQLFPGIAQSLQWLQENDIAWGIVTSKFFWLAAQLLNRLPLKYKPHCLIGRETLPCQKPDPLPLSYACRLLAVSPLHSIYIGDAETDMIAAKAAGMRSIAAAYGYLAEKQQAENWGANHVIYHASELTSLLQQLRL